MLLPQKDSLLLLFALLVEEGRETEREGRNGVQGGEVGKEGEQEDQSGEEHHGTSVSSTPSDDTEMKEVEDGETVASQFT